MPVSFDRARLGALKDTVAVVGVGETDYAKDYRAPGGEAVVCVAVATLSFETCTLHPRLNSDVLIAAALLHDIGKIREFSYGADISLSDEGRLLGHLAIGQRMTAERAAAARVPEAKALALLPCVLAHHGADALPGRRFGSAEALALYRLNALDASVKGALEHGMG